MDRAVKEKILAAAKSELLKHSLDTFKDDIPPSVIVTGCPLCRRQFGTINQLMSHLADDVLPVILRRAFAIAKETTR
jgi:Fe-S oxidoreductase